MDCVFCKIIAGEIPSYKIYEDDSVMAFLDIHPNSAGHTLIIPKKHILDVNTMDDETLVKIFAEARHVAKILMEKLGASGFTLIQNNGSCQEVKHFHLHVVPKYDCKVKMSIEDVYKKMTS